MRVTAVAVDYEARNRLVMAHVPLVKVLAQRLAHRLPREVELNELISVGVLGLVEAANRFQPSLGVPFDAFARRRVHGAMLDALRSLDWVPRSVRRLRRELDAAIVRLRHELGREPREAELAEAMNLSAVQFERAIEELRALELASIRPLDALGPDGETLLNVAIDPGEGPAAQFERREMRERLARAIEGLPARERQILALSYQQELTLAKIGDILGVSESRVCQLRTLALSRLRTTLAKGSDVDDVFEVFDRVIAAAPSGDTDALTSAASNLERAFERATALQSRVGASLQAVGDDKLRLAETKGASEAQLAALEDANMAAALTDMAQAETVYRAALAAAAQMQRLTLLDDLT